MIFTIKTVGKMWWIFKDDVVMGFATTYESAIYKRKCIMRDTDPALAG